MTFILLRSWSFSSLDSLTDGSSLPKTNVIISPLKLLAAWQLCGKFIISGGFIRRSLDICGILLPSMQPSEAPFDIPMKRILGRDLQVSFKRVMFSVI